MSESGRPGPRGLLREFHNPAAPIQLRPWTGRPRGPGLYVNAVAPADPARLPEEALEVEPDASLLPFDPERAIRDLVFEERFARSRPWHSYLPVESGIIPAAMRDRLLTSSLRHRLDRPGFPRWPVEPSVEEIRALVLRSAQRLNLAGAPAPFWPDGKSFAALLSHDLDSPDIYRKGLWKPFAELEEARGLRSSWHFCSSHVREARATLEELSRRGHEIGWHGPRHDYRFAYLSPDRIHAIMAEQRESFLRFGIRGFRSPFYLRTPGLYRGLSGELDYDSSPRDTAAEFLSPHVREGCCTVFPFFRENVVVLPLTVPEDHDAASLTGDDAEGIFRIQREKMEWIKKTGGLAVALTHPLPWLSLKPGAFGAYRKLVEWIAGEKQAWTPLARDAASWWRRRFETG